MKYHPSDLKAFDVFALILFITGVAFLAAGVVAFVVQPKVQYTIDGKPLHDELTAREVTDDVPVVAITPDGHPRVVKRVNCGALRNLALGFILVVLSLAFNTALRQVIRNRGADVGESADSPPDDENAA